MSTWATSKVFSHNTERQDPQFYRKKGLFFDLPFSRKVKTLPWLTMARIKGQEEQISQPRKKKTSWMRMAATQASSSSGAGHLSFPGHCFASGGMTKADWGLSRREKAVCGEAKGQPHAREQTHSKPWKGAAGGEWSFHHRFNNRQALKPGLLCTNKGR